MRPQPPTALVRLEQWSQREPIPTWHETAGVITIAMPDGYEFDSDKAENELRILRFDEPDRAWLEFVCANRSGRDTDELYDIVFCPVANDTVYAVVQFYENGIYDMEEAIKRLKVQTLYNQILFHTDKALTFCKYKGEVILCLKQHDLRFSVLNSIKMNIA